MRAPLLLTLCLGAGFFACADPEEEDAGTPVDTGVVVDTGVRDTGVATDTGTAIDTGVDSGVADDTGVDGGPGDTGVDGGSDGGELDAVVTDVDPGMDVAAPDGGPFVGPVTVLFGSAGSVLPGTAIFHDSTGVLIATQTTTTGVIVQDVPADSMLTVSAPILTGKGPTFFELNTLVGIQPGETYHVDPYLGAIPIIGDMGLSAGTPYPGATYYIYDYGCGTYFASDPTASLVVGIEAGCSGSSTTAIDLLVIAYDNTDAPIAFRVGEQIPMVPNGSVTLTDPWQTNFQSLDLIVANPQIGATNLAGSLGVSAHGATFGFENDVGFLDVSGGTGGTILMNRPTFGTGLIYRLDQYGANGELSWRASHLTTQAPVTSDLTADFLPFPDVVTVTPSVTNPERPTATWSSVAGVDFVALQIQVDDPAVQWQFILPSTATSLQLPELPDDFASYRPIATSAFNGAHAIVETDAIADYAGVRALVADSFLKWAQALDPQRLPPGVTVRGAIRGL